MNKVLGLSVFLFVLSYALTYLVKNFAMKGFLLDIPNNRSSHTSPTPKGGGLAIVVSWYTGISFLFGFDLISSKLYFALMGGIILAIFSFLDDIISLAPIVRLIAQTLSAAAALFFIGQIEPVVINNLVINNHFILYILTIIGMIWFVNLFNFLDGIDGYASLEAITVSIAIFFFTGNVICISLSACILGFMIWNWPKAKIFMGDIGSTQLGFILAILAIYFHNSGELHLLQWLILTSLFWFDATLTLIRRIIKREKLSAAHRKHGYQRIVIAGFSHQKTIIFSFFINIVIIFLALLTKQFTGLLLPVFITTMLLLYGFMNAIDRRVPFG